jgi:hypothetical protein
VTGPESHSQHEIVAQANLSSGLEVRAFVLGWSLGVSSISGKFSGSLQPFPDRGH